MPVTESCKTVLYVINLIYVFYVTNVSKVKESLNGDKATIIDAVGTSGALLVIAVIIGMVVLKFRMRKRYFDQLSSPVFTNQNIVLIM